MLSWLIIHFLHRFQFLYKIATVANEALAWLPFIFKNDVDNFLKTKMLRLTTVMLFLCLVLFQLSETKRSKSSIVSKSRIKSIKKGKSFKGKTNPKGSEIKWRKQATTGRRRRSGKRKTKRLKIRKRNRNARSFRQKLNWCKNKKRKCWRKNSNGKKKKRNKMGRGEVNWKNGSRKGEKRKRSAGFHCSMV